MTRYRLGIDIGGTFTDVVMLEESSGELSIDKLPSTPSNPAVGFLQGVDRALQRHAELQETLAQVVHATTIATNAVIEGKTARTALLVTHGFGDILEIARQTRPDLFDLFADKPKPIVPRDRCFQIRERMEPTGEVLEPLVEADVEAAIDTIQAIGVESVAICFLHSYRYPQHEQRAGELVRARCPNLWVSLSSEVLPEFREYRRASTTAVNAALLPIVRDYLDQIQEGLNSRGLRPSFHVMKSSGGVLTAETARHKPVHIMESGPAAGVIGATHLARLAGYEDVISLDMGGTTAKASLVRHGRPRVSAEFEVGATAMASRTLTRGRGYPIGTPTIDLVEIGAGGGSIAWIDAGGMLRVGPRSAGADPGPACYGTGGIEPTVTDANLVLGRLDPDYFLGGQMALDMDAAKGAIARIAQPFGMSPVEAAAGILEIANASMVDAIRLVSTQRGFDPREFTMVAFGGAGPLHANALAHQLGIPRVLIPRSPGVASALGLLFADIEHEFVLTTVQPFGALDHAALNAHFAEFVRRGRVALEADGVGPHQMAFLRSVDVRYVGQSYELPVPVPEGEWGGELEAILRERFHGEHRRAYGHAAPEEPIELVNLRLTAVGRTQKPALRPLEAPVEPMESALRGRRALWVDGQGPIECRVYDRYRLGPGARLSGPAVVEEFDSTVLILPGWRGTVDGYGHLLLEPDGRRS